MKKILILTILLRTFASAQTIQTTDVNPTLGHSAEYYVSNAVFEGYTGSSITWDLTAMDSVGLMTRKYKESTFSGANLRCSDSTNGSVYNFDLQIGDSGIRILNQDTSNLEIPFTIPMNYLVLPADFGTSEHTQFYGLYINSGGDTIQRAGWITQDFDGTGLLITPKGNFPNASRIHLRQVFVDDEINHQYQTEYDVHIYLWFVPGFTDEVAALFRKSYNASGNNITVTYGRYLNVSTLGVDEKKPQILSSYPNPFNESLCFQLNGEQLKSVSVRDTKGIEYPANFASSSNLAYLTFSNLPSGEYIVIATFNSGSTKIEKIVKQ